MNDASLISDLAYLKVLDSSHLEAWVQPHKLGSKRQFIAAMQVPVQYSQGTLNTFGNRCDSRFVAYKLDCIVFHL